MTTSLRRRTGDGVLLYTQTLLHSPVPRWENCKFVDRNFQLRFLVTIRRMRVSAVQIGKEQGEVGKQPLVAEPASLLLTFTDTPVLQHFSTQRLNSRPPRD